MMRQITARLAVALVLTTSIWAYAQEADKADKKAAASSDEKTPLVAKVVEAVGGVEYAPVGTDALDTESWKSVKKEMELGAGNLIRTGLRSRCTLLFGAGEDQTVISIRRATLASIDQVYRTETEQRVRVGLGYGTVRGGSSEGTLHSDVVIESPVATLAKRGTEGYEIEVEQTTGRFRISLAQSGLVTARSTELGLRRDLRPGEYVTDSNIARMWVNQDIFDRTIRFYDVEGVSPEDLLFMIESTGGLSGISPGGGFSTWGLTGLNGSGINGSITLDDSLLNLLPTIVVGPTASHRPEGHFGFGPTLRVLVPTNDIDRINARRDSGSGRLLNRRQTLPRG